MHVTSHLADVTAVTPTESPEGATALKNTAKMEEVVVRSTAQTDLPRI